jgi:hypothetical protein
VQLHQRLRSYYGAALEKSSGLEQQRVLFDYIFLHRDNSMVKPFLEWQESGTQAPDGLREGDTAAVLEMVRMHEGTQSAELAAYWLERQPGGALIFRDAEGTPAGYLQMISLEETEEHDATIDPAVRAAMTFLSANAPLRRGDKALLFRFWMGKETYQAVSPMQSLIFVNVVRQYFNPALSFSLLPCADYEFWAPLFAYADLNRLEAADFEVGGRQYGVYGHNWRSVPALAWLNVLADREIATSPPAAPPQPSAPLVVLSQVEFGAAVQDALRGFLRSDLLRRNPLLQSRLVVEKAGPQAGQSERTAALQELIRESADSLKQSPRDLKLYKALYHTYLQPAATQEQAAELLDLPFSTFRRHLKEGVARLADNLWDMEVGG